jgi:atypical dual specificity phosphatase
LNGGGELNAYRDELPQLHRAGIRAVVCLLNMPGDLPVFQSAGFDFRCFPIENGQPPAPALAREFIEYIKSCRLRNLPVAVFCQAGSGRTCTVIACYLIHTGKTAAQAIAELRGQEKSAVETPAQIRFLEEFEKRQRQNG